MANGNPFYIDPAISRGFTQGLGQLGTAYFQRQQQQQQQQNLMNRRQQTMTLLNQFNQAQDPQERQQLFLKAFQSDPEMVRGYMSELRAQKEADLAGQPESKPMQKGEGALVFNPNTGSYSIDETAKSYLDKKASELAAKKGNLGTSDIRSINKDLTDFTKQAKAAKTSASSIERLAKVNNPAAQVAIIFNYMKSLDPTSVVRESEQGMVASASGPMEQFAAQINRITGEGPLTPEVTQQIIDAAKANSNVLIQSANEEATSFLNAFGDKIGQEQRERFDKRLIKPFDIQVTDQLEEPQRSEEVVQDLTKMSDQELKQQLGI